jgi:hypothetical protein
VTIENQNKKIAVEFDALSGEFVSRELNAIELAELTALHQEQVALKAEEEIKKIARQSALAKLAALGLTEEEIAAL